MFGDNNSIVNSSNDLYAKLHKRHNILSFHQVRESIASKYVEFVFLSGKENPADILSKHWAHSKVYPLLRPLLFWSGDTMDSEWIYIFIYYILYIYNVIENNRRTLQKVMELTQMLLCSHFKYYFISWYYFTIIVTPKVGVY